MKPTIIYIAGYGYSGSTLLERSLADNSGIVGCGELWRLAEDFDDYEVCGCDKNVEECSHWKSVYKKYKENNALSNNDLLNILLTQKDIPFIIDNSKTGYSRISRLHKILKEDQVKVIHLIREPGNVMNSYLKKSKRSNIFIKLFLALKLILHWNYANSVIYRLQKKYSLDVCLVRFEDFLENPKSEIIKIHQFLDYHPPIVSFDPIKTHQLTGNIYRHGDIVFKKLPISLSNIYSSMIRRFSSKAMAKYGYQNL